jgi:hypothetical protein
MSTYKLLLSLVGYCRYDHQERLSAKEALAHPYFAAIREAALRGSGLPV